MIDPIDRRDKRLRAVDEELRDLRRRRRITVPLEVPVQVGWVRSYTVADHVASPHLRAILFDILKVIGTTQWSRYPNFLVQRRRKTPLVEIAQSLRNIPASAWDNFGYPEAWKRYFCLESERNQTFWHPTYVFACRRYLEFKVDPFFATERSYPDPDVERRIAELEQWLNHHHLTPRMYRLRGMRQAYPWDTSRRKALLHAHRHEMKEAVRQFPEIDPAPSTHWRCTSLRTVLFSPA